MENAEYKKTLAKMPAGEGERPLLAMPAGKYMRNAQCENCHSDVHPADPHANAFQTLAKEEQ